MNVNSTEHFGTCAAWASGSEFDCDCVTGMAPWRIRKDHAKAFPWRIWRRTDDDDYIPLLRCSTFAAAMAMVTQLQALRVHYLRKDHHDV